MEWEAQSAKEMGKKYYPLMGPGGGDELSLVGEPVRDVAGQNIQRRVASGSTPP